MFGPLIYESKFIDILQPMPTSKNAPLYNENNNELMLKSEGQYLTITVDGIFLPQFKKSDKGDYNSKCGASLSMVKNKQGQIYKIIIQGLPQKGTYTKKSDSI